MASATTQSGPIGGGGVSETEFIVHLEENATKLQKDGKYLEALALVEQGLVMRHRIYGPKSKEVLSASKAAGEMCNLLAMTYLQREEYALVSELLKKAEILTESDPPGRAITYNNMACFSRQQGKLHAALTYLQRALKIEEKIEEVQNPSDTHLNLCAVLSQLGRHSEALEHAQAALKLLHEELFGGASGATASHKPDRIAVLAICYHNIGVECEFLKHYPASLQAYTKGVEVATVYLGKEHGITATLKKSQRLAREEIEKIAAKLEAKEKAAAEPRTMRSRSPRAEPSRSPRARDASPRPAGAAKKSVTLASPATYKLSATSTGSVTSTLMRSNEGAT